MWVGAAQLNGRILDVQCSGYDVTSDGEHFYSCTHLPVNKDENVFNRENNKISVKDGDLETEYLCLLDEQKFVECCVGEDCNSKKQDFIVKDAEMDRTHEDENRPYYTVSRVDGRQQLYCLSDNTFSSDLDGVHGQSACSSDAGYDYLGACCGEDTAYLNSQTSGESSNILQRMWDTDKELKLPTLVNEELIFSTIQSGSKYLLFF